MTAMNIVFRCCFISVTFSLSLLAFTNDMTLNYLQVCQQLSALVVWYFSCITRVLCNCSIGVLKPAYTVNIHSAPRLTHILGAVVRCYRRPDLFPGRK